MKNIKLTEIRLTIYSPDLPNEELDKLADQLDNLHEKIFEAYKNAVKEIDTRLDVSIL